MISTAAAHSSHRRSLALPFLAVARPLARSMVAFALALLFGIGAGPVLAASAQHSSFTVAGGPVDCGAHQYTFVSGSFDVVVHDGVSPSGNNQTTVDGRADNITAVDTAGNLYRVVGIFHFGGSFNPILDAGPFHFGMKLQIIGAGGGVVDNVNVVLSSSPFGAGRDFVSIGSCAPLA